MKFKIYKYKSITSTNDKAIEYIKNKNIMHGYIYSEYQTFGRGTSGKKWISERGNFFGSIFFPLKKNYPNFDEFAFINPVLIFDIIKSFCIDCNLALKWPNDILINKKKICGILQEVVNKKKFNFLIIGIGINLISNPDLSKNNATNILRETNINIKKNEILKKVILSYEKFFSEINKYNFKYYKKKANSLAINIK